LSGPGTFGTTIKTKLKLQKKPRPDKKCEKEKCQAAIETKPVKKLTKNCNREWCQTATKIKPQPSHN
jgi:hypothetical protein